MMDKNRFEDRDISQIPLESTSPANQASAHTPQRIVVLCIGNILMRDEGVGPRVADELLRRYQFGSEVEVLDRGVMGMSLLADIRGATRLLIVDAVDNTGEPPGTLFKFKPEDLADYEAFHGAHDTRLVDVLQALALLGSTFETDCFGVQVEDMLPPNYQIGLTPAVEAAVEPLVGLVIEWLFMQGVSITKGKS